MFDLISPKTARARMRELNKFIDFWYGPHSKEYEFRDPPEAIPLSLRLFYQRNGRRSPINPRLHDSAFFYEGAGGHHLFPPKLLGFRSKGRVKFFMEYQGDFYGYTEREGVDPPVTLRGQVPAGDVHDYGFTTVESTGAIDLSLSQFLVTHILLTTIYECQNHERKESLDAKTPWSRNFSTVRSWKQLIWDAGTPTGIHCPYYFGRVYLLRDTALAHDDGNRVTIAWKPELRK